MNTYRTIFLLVLLSSFTLPLQSQSTGGGCNSSGPEHYLAIQRSSHPERLTFAFGNDLIISIECREISEIPTGLDSVVGQAAVHLERLRDTLKTLTPPWLISITPGQGGIVLIAIVTDTIAPINMVYQPQEQTYLPTRFRYTLVYSVSHQHTLVISTNDPESLGQLSSIRFDALTEQAQSHIAAQDIPRFAAKSVTYQVVNGVLDTEGGHIHRFGSRGLGLSISPGISYLNSTFAPSFAFPLVFVRSSKNGQTIAYGFAFDMLLNMDPKTPYRIRNNWYAEGVFRIGSPATTFSAGYLMHRDGDLLPPSACRIGIGVPVNRSGSMQWFTAYHFSTTNKGQALFETGIRMWR